MYLPVKSCLLLLVCVALSGAITKTRTVSIQAPVYGAQLNPINALKNTQIHTTAKVAKYGAIQAGQFGLGPYGAFPGAGVGGLAAYTGYGGVPGYLAGSVYGNNLYGNSLYGNNLYGTQLLGQVGYGAGIHPGFAGNLNGYGVGVGIPGSYTVQTKGHYTKSVGYPTNLGGYGSSNIHVNGFPGVGYGHAYQGVKQISYNHGIQSYPGLNSRLIGYGR